MSVFTKIPYQEVREISLRSVKSQGKVREDESRKKLATLRYVKFILSEFEHPNFETFLGEHAPRSPLTVLDIHKNLIVVWKSQGISSFLETGHPVPSHRHDLFSKLNEKI